MEDLTRLWAEELRRQKHRSAKAEAIISDTNDDESVSTSRTQYIALFAHLRAAISKKDRNQITDLTNQLITLRAKEAAEELTKDSFSAILGTSKGQRIVTRYVNDAYALVQTIEREIAR